MLLQAADYVQSKKHIPDLATWTQCFAIYSAVLVTKYPERAQTLFMYSAIIARLSKQFRWPSFIIYDQYFCQEAADTGKTDWSKIDSSIHAQCFTGMSLSAEGWCSICTSMDHVKATCPYRPADDQLGQKRPFLPQKELALSSGQKRLAASGTGTTIWRAPTGSPVHTLMYALAAVQPTTES